MSILSKTLAILLVIMVGNVCAGEALVIRTFTLPRNVNQTSDWVQQNEDKLLTADGTTLVEYDKQGAARLRHLGNDFTISQEMDEGKKSVTFTSSLTKIHAGDIRGFSNTIVLTPTAEGGTSVTIELHCDVRGVRPRVVEGELISGVNSMRVVIEKGCR